MKLKLSTLLIIIVVIFFAYYYFVYAPCQKAAQMKKLPVTTGQHLPAHSDGGYQPEFTMLPPSEDPNMDYGDSITVLDSVYGYPYEGFAVTNVEAIQDAPSSRAPPANAYTTAVEDVAGNVRPDNVMQVSEPVTLL